MVFIQEIRKRGLKVSIVGIPKTIDNDIPVNTIYKLFFLFSFFFLSIPFLFVYACELSNLYFTWTLCSCIFRS